MDFNSSVINVHFLFNKSNNINLDKKISNIQNFKKSQIVRNWKWIIIRQKLLKERVYQLILAIDQPVTQVVENS